MARSLGKNISIKKPTKTSFFTPLAITVLSSLTFVISALIDIFVLRNKLGLSGNLSLFSSIILSLSVIVVNLFIVKKWFSWREVGIQKGGFFKALLYSIVFITILKIFSFLLNKESLVKNVVWNKSYLLHLSGFLFLAFQEELMFRGIIFRAWERYKGFLFAMVISSLLFGLEHLLYPGIIFEKVHVAEVIAPAFFGTTFAFIVYRTNNIWALSLSHFIYNFISLLTEENIGDFESEGSLIVLLFYVYIFMPIILDFFDRKIFKVEQLNIPWEKYLASFFTTLFIIVSFFLVFEDFKMAKKVEIFSDPEEEKKDDLGRCEGVDLRLNEVRNKLGGNQKALQILRDNCLWLLDSFIHDFTGDGKEEIAMVAAIAPCATCRVQKVYIIKDDEVIFEKDTEDVSFRIAEDYPGFTIKYPLRKRGEPYCCPTEGIIESYIFSRDTNSFYSFDERCEPYRYNE